MPESKYAKKRLWRWRNNPLRRRDDIVEAWVVLAVWMVVTVGGAGAGLVTATAADAMFARQRTERHSVQAVVVNDVPRKATAFGADNRRTVKVRWVKPDGSTRTGRTLVSTGLDAGSRVTVWQDGRGRLTLAPTAPTEAAVASGFLGVLAAAALTGLAFGAGAGVRWWLEGRRIDEWGREWDLVGPQWGRQTS